MPVELTLVVQYRGWTGNCRIEPTGLLQRSGAIFINIAATRNGVFGKDSLLQVGVPRKPCK